VKVLVRNARQDDSDLLLRWRNHPDTRRWSLSSSAVNAGGHEAWLSECLLDPDRVLLLAEEGGAPVGTVRFDRDGQDDRWEVSITLAPEHRGRGLAGAVLDAGESFLLGARPYSHLIVARVRTANTASRRLFEAAGYILSDDSPRDGVLTFSKRLVPIELSSRQRVEPQQ
jgi:RimJ/RimL family protein N-acetyltransferase